MVKSIPYKSEVGPSEADMAKTKTSAGDDMKEWLWDGPVDSDEEIEELLPFKNQNEKQLGIKFSKNGIKTFIENLLHDENPLNPDDFDNAKLWEVQLDQEKIKLYKKSTGSKLNQDQPYLRSELKFNKMFKMNKIAKMVSTLYNSF